jgi:hypothetical protein
MGFNCKLCGDREIWVFESPIYKRICWDCHRLFAPETHAMERHRIRNASFQHTWVTQIREKKSVQKESSETVLQL